MQENILKPRGTQDFTIENESLYRALEDFLIQKAYDYGAKRVDVPTFEETRLFVRSVGNSSDIVNKEMFKLDVKGEHDYVLRPEFTASINRMLVENKLYASPDLPLKFSYCGSVFRFERPQAGRFREFHQFGVEFLDNKIDFLTSLDALCLLYRAGQSLLNREVELKINFLGGKQSRDNYRKALKDFYKDKIDCMCEDCKKRYEINVLRILDCKVDSDIEINKNAPKLSSYLIEEDLQAFNHIKEALDFLNINYKVDEKLVRGLDYYTGLVFELYDPLNRELGAIGAGGQYGNLTSEISNINFEGIGFSFGVERLMLSLSEQRKEELLKNVRSGLDYFIVDLRQNKDLIPLEIADILRETSRSVSFPNMNKGLKGDLKMADRLKVKRVIMFDDYNPNKVVIKNMSNREQTVIDMTSSSDIVKYLIESEEK